MTSFARKVLSRLARHEPAGHHEQLQHAAGLHRRFGQGRRQGRRAGQLDAVDLRPLRIPQPDDGRPAEHPAAVRRRRQRAHLREQPAVRSRHAPGCRPRLRCSRCVSAIRGRRRARIRRRSAPTSALDEFGLPGLPTDDRISGGLPTQLITGYSDLGRQATNPQWQYPTVYNPKMNYTWTMKAHSFKSGYEFQQIDTQVQDVNPLYGRDTYNGQFSRPSRRGVEQSLQPRRLHARPARAVRAQQRARRGPAPQHALSHTSRMTGAPAAG